MFPPSYYRDQYTEAQELEHEALAQRAEEESPCPECGEGFDSYGPDWCSTHLAWPELPSS
jgi:hypothetical protein